MVRFLIMAIDKTGTADTPYQQGDIVVVKPEGWEWGKAEHLPSFLRVDVTDMSWYEAESLADSLVDNEGNLVQRRKFFCTQTIKPGNQDRFNQAVANDEVYTTTKDDFIMYALQERE